MFKTIGTVGTSDSGFHDSVQQMRREGVANSATVKNRW